MKLSRAQIDRMGERLRLGNASEADLRLLDDYRSSFGSAYRSVTAIIWQKLRKRPSGRPRKTTDSIVAKLDRETIRLSQMQDIAGCRLVVSSVAVQDRVVSKLGVVFATSSVIDRRLRPTHGYRAVHVIATLCGKPIEIQVRTKLQDLWAQLSEKMADSLGKDVKYGGGPEEERRKLDILSEAIKRIESSKMKEMRPTLSKLLRELIERGGQ